MTGSMPAQSAVDAFEEAGFVVVPRALDPVLRAAARESAERLLASTVSRGRDRGSDGKDGFRGFLALDPDTFLPLVDNPAVLPTEVRLLSPNIYVLSSHLIALPSIGPGQRRTIRTPQRPGWHRDMFGVDADLGTAHTPRLAVKCAYYLTNPLPDTGVTMFLPGSHTLREPPRRPTGHIDPPGAVTPELDEYGGDAVLFENRTYHAGGLNSPGRPRLAIMIQYGYRWLAPVEDPAPALLDRPGIGAIQRQLLGAPDRHPDGSLAKGVGAAPLRNFVSRYE
jgi:Phytanoyl-CoA dioxygenase (PhyH)